MSPERDDTIRQIFGEAIQLPEADRPLFLERRCGPDVELRQQVESLLEQPQTGSTSILDLRVRREAARLLAVGSKLGPYEILSLIGSGGMGEVYRARDLRLNRDVAIKVSKERFSDRFEREARAVAALNHPNICTLYDIGPDYLVMEYLEGHTLRGPLPLRTALQYAVQAADALQAAHAKGVIHRDFKPGNILITRSGLKLLDFGLAKIGGPSSAKAATSPLNDSLTQNNIFGTLQYMSPEQLEGKSVDARSDIFSFGLVLYEAIAGTPPFRAESQASLITAILTHESPPLSSQPGIPPALDRLVRKCLAKDPAARWQTAADLSDELQWIARSIAESTGVPARVPATRRRAVPWLMAALALVACAAAAVLWQSLHAPGPAAWVATRLSGPPTAFCPRISPDGQLIAFLTLVNRLTQVAVMKSDGSSWTVLTSQNDAGYISDLSWAQDGSKIYFSRYFDRPHGVYSVPVLGGETRLIAENTFGCYPLPDASLIVAGLANQGDYQLRRFWPESGRSEPLPGYFYGGADHPAVAVFPGGREVAFYGIYSTSQNHSGTPGIYALDLETQKARALGTALGTFRYLTRPLAVTPDGKSVITLAQAEDVAQVVTVPGDGGSRREVLFPLPSTDQVNYLSAGSDGSIYLDAWNRPNLLLGFSEDGGNPEETVEPKMLSAFLGALPGGRFLFPTLTGGKSHLEAASPGGESRPFLQSSDQSGMPFAVTPDGTVAFKLGTPPNQQMAIASFRHGQILRRLGLKSAEVRSVALSPDGQTLYYAASGSIWSLPVSESAPPHRIVEGDQVAIDPSGRAIYVKQMAKDPAVLVRVPVTGGIAEPVRIPKNLHLTSDLLPPNAVDIRGRILFETSSADSFFFSAALFDPARQSVTRLPVRFDGDIWSPIWAGEGRIAAVGARFASSLWHFHPVNRH